MNGRDPGFLASLLSHWEDVAAAMVLLASLAATVQALDRAQWPAARRAAGLVARTLISCITAGALVMLAIYDLSLHPATKGALAGVGALFGEVTQEMLYQAYLRPLLERLGIVRRP